MASTSIPLHINQSDPSSELLSFPLIFTNNDSGSKTLQPQVRFSQLGDIQGGKDETVFITLYGFIQTEQDSLDLTHNQSTFQVLGQTSKPDTITAACIPLGATTLRSTITRMAEESLELLILVKKSAVSSEKLAVSFINIPPSLAGILVIRAGGFILSAEEYVKSPSKLQAGYQYKFKPVFITCTRIFKGKLYKVPKSMHYIASELLYKAVLEIQFQLDIKPDHPQTKMLKKQDTNEGPEYYGFVWFHLLNFKKTTARGEIRTLEKISDKIRAMGIKVSLYDLWGPTILAEITGKKSKYAQGFFSLNGCACLPVARASPEIAKLIWSCSTRIKSATIIVQSSDKRGLLNSEDLEIKGAVGVSPRKLGSYSLFKKH
ncbi:matrix protein [avian paramyxovirus 15]|uniref:Matrix protein n=1 Tax=avian paramyxovirus 15 TaxID=1983777 RepID=A0A1W6R4S3_9MONO|nr:matrix protein [Avian paramyxovirus 15]ARO49355.1 matrix protein [Avian paramyxovirus 15]